MFKLFIDFETRGTADLKRVGAHKYAVHPDTDALCLAFSFWKRGDENARVHLWKMGEQPSRELRDLFNFIGDGMAVRGHNVTFDVLIWNEVMSKRNGWPFILPHLLEDSMAEAYAMGLPGSLEKAAAAVGIQEQKDMAGHRVMMQLSRPREVKEDGTIIWWTPESAPEKFEKLYAYCVQDLKVEMLLSDRLLPLSPQERAVWLLDYKINQRGIRVDIPAVKTALALVEYEKARLNEEMKRVTGGAVSTCTATGQLTDWVGWQLGREIDGVAKADVTELLASADLPAEVRKALELRREGNKSSTAKLAAMLEAASGDDDRVRGMYQYHGAGPGRWAGRRLQLQNFPRPVLTQEEIENVFGIMAGAQ